MRLYSFVSSLLRSLGCRDQCFPPLVMAYLPASFLRVPAATPGMDQVGHGVSSETEFAATKVSVTVALEGADVYVAETVEYLAVVVGERGRPVGRPTGHPAVGAASVIAYTGAKP